MSAGFEECESGRYPTRGLSPREQDIGSEQRGAMWLLELWATASDQLRDSDEEPLLSMVARRDLRRVVELFDLTMVRRGMWPPIERSGPVLFQLT